MAETDSTPLMRQYQDIKRQHQDAILFFRVGDFYEMFFEDAEEASTLLDIVLTARGKNKGQPVPLCGVPYHAATGYISKLLKAGRTVALCEQVEDPKSTKGIVRREVVRVFTPGTLFDSELLPSHEANFLAALSYSTASATDNTRAWGLATLEMSTGDFSITAYHERSSLMDELQRLEPAEILVSSSLPDHALRPLHDFRFARLVTCEPSWFDDGAAAEQLCTRFHVDGMDTLEIPASHIGLGAAGCLLQYVSATQPNLNHQHIQRPRVRIHRREMLLDGATIRNLELIKPLFDQRNSPTLLSVINHTMTPMGSRLLKQWIIRPLIDLEAIHARQEAVSGFVEHLRLRTEFRQCLKDIQDLERVNSRVVLGVASPRDMAALQRSLAVLPAALAHVKQLQGAGLLDSAIRNWDMLQDVHDHIAKAIVSDPPQHLRDGGVIRDGYHAELDALRQAAQEGMAWLAELEAREKARTGIESLKVKFNQVFGYYLEVTKPNLSRVPADYSRKQTLVNAERFTTEELRTLEDRILGADQKRKSLEQSLFAQLCETVGSETPRIQHMARLIAELDVLANFAEVAARHNYVKPLVNKAGVLVISGGRHPVIEHMPLHDGFISNDTSLDLDQQRVLLITGPNMAGKSTYLRQVALIVLLAQMGSGVPADRAHVGLVDRVFTRIGAADDLTAGQSTFMMEMSETSKIMSAATSRSLILLDEVGRGTSTYDGLSIAWAVVEYLLDRRHIGARTLFATHYHEMTQLEELREGVKNYTVLIKEQDHDLLFLRKIVEGRADRSYGIHVAKLAGLPSDVIARAQEILTQLEADHAHTRPPDPQQQTSLLEPLAPQPHVILDEVKQLDLFTMTPLDALNRLADFKRRLDAE